jgi:hypothetical protein
MKTEYIVRLIAGTIIITSVLLAHYHSPDWLWLTGWVGFMLGQSAFTGFCPPCIVVNKLLKRPPGTC